MPLHIVYASDQNYSLGLQVSIASLLCWIDPSQQVALHILDGGINRATWKKLEKLANRLHPHTKITQHDIRNSPIHSLSIHGGLGIMTLARLHIPELIVADRALYLDVDLLILGDISKLLSMDMNGYSTAAVRDPLIKELVHDNPFPGLSDQELLLPYFNGGVMLFDLALWRDERTAEAAFELLNIYGPNCKFHDQTVLNYLLRGCWQELPASWNSLSKCLSWTNEEGITPRPKPAVLHYCAVVKPWISAIEPWPAHRLWHLFARHVAGISPWEFNRMVMGQIIRQRCKDKILARERLQKSALTNLLPSK